MLIILAVLSATLAMAEDFKTIKGKVYKDATIRRVEADGIVVSTKTGISKIYFVELPKEVQERFRPSPAKTAAAQPERKPVKVEVKQNQPRPTEAGGLAGALQVSTGFVRLLAVGALLVAGLVIFFVRSRLG
jgi:hypothetical protein